MESQTAASKVASVSELLEDILLNLPLRHLLLAQKVSKSFYLCIHNSIKIKRALYLAPSSDGTACWEGPITKGVAFYANGDWKISTTGEIVRPVLNPFMISTSIPTTGPKWHRTDSGTYFNEHEVIRFEEHCQVFRRGFVSQRGTSMGGRSFADMQITHPPVRSMHLSRAEARARSERVIDIGEVQNSAGIRFGELIEKTYMPLHEHYTGHAILGGSKWLAVAESVDVLTGWEMLHLLEGE